MSADYDELRSWRELTRFVARLARPEARLLALLVAISVILSLLEGAGLTLGLLAVYRLMGVGGAIDEFAGEPGIELVTHLDTNALIVGAIVMVVVAAVLSSVVRILGEIVANRVTHRARTTIYENYLVSTYEHASRRGHGAMLDTLDYEAPLLTEAVLHASAILSDLCAVLVYTVYLLILSPALGGSALVLGLALVALLGLVARPVSVLGGRVSLLNERLLAHTMATVAGLRTIRLHAAERDFSDRYGAASRAVADAHVTVAVTHGVVGALRQIGKLAAFAALLWSAIAFAVPAAVTVMVLALLLRVLPHVTDAEERLVSLFNSRLPLSIVNRAMDRTRMPIPHQGAGEFAGMRQGITLERIDFAHDPDTPVLRDVNFDIPAGALVTLVGPSGGGKTTIINLLARLYEPQGGRILVDGVPLDRLNRQSWLARLGFSGQDIDLQEGTVLENIRFFDAGIAEADVRWAMKVAHIDEVVDALPDGVHTAVGDRGLRLSGGQRQRIGLARAIVRRPELLILDEATNAVDVGLEARILADIRRALPDTTILIVTHRAAVAGADREYVLDGGQVRARGDVA